MATEPAQRTSPPGLIGRRRAERLDRLAELAATPPDERGESLTRETLRRLRRSPMAMVGASIVLIFVVIALIGPLLTPPRAGCRCRCTPRSRTSGWSDPPARSRAPAVTTGWAWITWAGTSSAGSYGARQTLLVGVVATLIGFTAGAVIGGLAGAAYGLGGRIGRWIDSILMRFIDLLLAMPPCCWRSVWRRCSAGA